MNITCHETPYTPNKSSKVLIDGHVIDMDAILDISGIFPIWTINESAKRCKFFTIRMIGNYTITIMRYAPIPHRNLEDKLEVEEQEKASEKSLQEMRKSLLQRWGGQTKYEDLTIE